MFRRRKSSDVKRRLSKEGQSLFTTMNEGNHEQTPLSAKGKSLFNCLFYTKDDKYIETLLSECRKSSKYLLGDLYDEKIPSMIDKFIFNIITLILKDSESNDVAKYHISKKNYKLFLKLGEQALKSQDHNTAWLIRNALLNTSLIDLQFLSKNIDTISFFKQTKELYGEYNHSFQNHILDVAEMYGNPKAIESEKYIPIVAVFRMYTKKCNIHMEAMRKFGNHASQSKSNRLLHIEKVIKNYINHYSKLEGKTSLIPLYEENVQLPDEDEKRDINFGDLISLSKKVSSTNHRLRWSKERKSNVLKRTKCLRKHVETKNNILRIENGPVSSPESSYVIIDKTALKNKNSWCETP